MCFKKKTLFAFSICITVLLTYLYAVKITSNTSISLKNRAENASLTPILPPANKALIEEVPMVMSFSKQFLNTYCQKEEICDHVKKLIERDLNALNQIYKTLDKHFYIKSYNTSFWDEKEKDLGCGTVSRGENLPFSYVSPLDCTHDQSYILVEYMKESGGGEVTWNHSIRLGICDNDCKDANDSHVLVHEVGHIFGQIHPIDISIGGNEIIPDVSYKSPYQAEFDPQIPYDIRNNTLWKSELVKRTYLNTTDLTIYRDLPDEVTINLTKTNNQLFTDKDQYTIFYGIPFEFFGYTISKNNVLLSGSLTNSSIMVNKNLYNKYNIFLIYIKSGIYAYYTYLNVAELNLAYWSGNVNKVTLQKDTTQTSYPVDITIELNMRYLPKDTYNVEVVIEKKVSNKPERWEKVNSLVNINSYNAFGGKLQSKSKITEKLISTDTYRVYAYGVDSVLSNAKRNYDLPIKSCFMGTINTDKKYCILQLPGSVLFQDWSQQLNQNRIVIQ